VSVKYAHSIYFEMDKGERPGDIHEGSKYHNLHLSNPIVISFDLLHFHFPYDINKPNKDNFRLHMSH